MRTCNICGAVVSEEAKFCRSCGSKLGEPEYGAGVQDGGYPEEHTVLIDESAPERTEPLGNDDRGFDPGGAETGYEEAYEPQYGQYQQAQPQYEQPRQAQPQYEQPQQAQPQYSRPQTAAYQPWDRTSEFDPKDISDNKAVCMLIYLIPSLGVIIAFLSSSTSPYAGFHARQGIKILVLELIVVIISSLLSPLILPSLLLSIGASGGLNTIAPLAGMGVLIILIVIAVLVMYALIFIIRVISFFSICKGNAKEPPIIRSLKFLN